MTDSQKNPDVSIVVCTFNRSGMLSDALRSLAELRTDGRFTYEIVVIDNASTDDTPAVVAERAAASPAPVRYVREEQKGIVPARNRGIREARGRRIAFFDDDQLALHEWLFSLWTTAEEMNAGCVGGPVHLKFPNDGPRDLHPACRMLLGESDWSRVPARYDAKRCPGAGNMMVDRERLLAIGGFDPAFNVRGEDTDLFLRLLAAGCDAWYAPQAVVLHVMTPQRLEDAYILRLADWMGGSVAEKEFRLCNRPAFALRWGLKFLRGVLWERTRFHIARLRGGPEDVLGWKCRCRISQAYLQRGRQLLQPAPLVAPATLRQSAST